MEKLQLQGRARRKEVGGKAQGHRQVNHESSNGRAEGQALQALIHEFLVVLGRQQLQNLVPFVLDTSQFRLQHSGIAMKRGLESGGLMAGVRIDCLSVPVQCRKEQIHRDKGARTQ